MQVLGLTLLCLLLLLSYLLPLERSEAFTQFVH
jgi:hypothetical protein